MTPFSRGQREDIKNITWSLLRPEPKLFRRNTPCRWPFFPLPWVYSIVQNYGEGWSNFGIFVRLHFEAFPQFLKSVIKIDQAYCREIIDWVPALWLEDIISRSRHTTYMGFFFTWSWSPYLPCCIWKYLVKLIFTSILMAIGKNDYLISEKRKKLKHDAE
jgi:hypothetical protein